MPALLPALLSLSTLLPAPAAARAVQAEVELRALTDAAQGFTRATHVRVRGSPREIGRALAELAAERHHFRPPPARDRAATAAQGAYFGEHAPLQLERMRGAAEHFRLEPDTHAFELAELGLVPGAPGCTVAFFPPGATEGGQGVLSRNFDFSTGTFDGRPPAPGATPVCATPYVLELHPDEGYATLCVVAFDLFGVVDGINSEGLVIALLADDEIMDRARPAAGVQAGFDVLQIGRHVLETCADVPEAERALRAARLYYSSIPCHYLVADRHGRSFVWENELDLSGGHVIAGGGRPQFSTNYLQHLHPDPEALPPDADELGLFGRECLLRELVAGQGLLSLDEIRADARRVAALRPARAGSAPTRTLWHALYFPGSRRMEVDFYLGEGAGSGRPVRRSNTFSFELEVP